jgi:glycosyltransferase involved in cell wall biosynthesis
MNVLDNKSFVSIIMPCLNEEKYIEKCLDSIIANEYPKDNMEIIIVDGQSTDRTREIIGKYINKYYFIKMMERTRRNKRIGVNKTKIVVKLYCPGVTKGQIQFLPISRIKNSNQH